MKSLILIELRKTLGNRRFVISLGFGTLCAAACLWSVLKTYYSDLGMLGHIVMLEREGVPVGYDPTQLGNLYQSWIGGAGMNPGSALFYTLLPLLCALPCGWGVCEELSSGYLHMAAPLCGRRRYFAAKMAAFLMTGGLVALVPQLLSLMLTAMFIPAVRPNIVYYIYYPISHGAMLSGLFYAHPLCYVLIILCIDIMFGGLFAWLSMTVALLTGNRIRAVVIPFLLILAGDLSENLILYVCYWEISPLNILHPLSAPNVVKGWIILAWMALLLAVSVPILLRKGERYEIS